MNDALASWTRCSLDRLIRASRPEQGSIERSSIIRIGIVTLTAD
jgi:hypothetical protein